MATVPFSIYLVKQGAEAQANQLLPQPEPIDLPGLDASIFSLIPNDEVTPAWFEALSPLLPAKQRKAPVSQTPAALLACSAAGRRILVSFGAAHAGIPKQLVVRGFGRRVAMNAVPPDQVVELNAHQVFAAFHKVNERAPGATRHRTFSVEGDRDLVAGVEGISQNPKLGVRIRGSTALHIELEPADLGAAIAEAVALFVAPNKFAEWSEYDNLNRVTDDAEIQSLDADLDTHLAGKPATLTLAAPGDEQYAGATTYHVGRMTKVPAHHPLLFPSTFYGKLSGGVVPSITEAKKLLVHVFDANRQIIGKPTNIYDCICYETSVGGKSYVLWAGDWFEADLSFARRIRALVAGLKAPKHPLPNWNRKDNEGVFNTKAGAASGFQNLDKKLIYFGGGHSKFEFCDVLHSASKTLYFVKQYSASATMSHLVEQIRRTAELFFSGDGAYRLEMSKAGHSVPTKRPRNGDWHLCLVVMGRRLDKLPLFAQCGIARLARDLEKSGHSFFAQSV